MRVVMVIPTYCGRSRQEPLNPEDVVYDHPTPIDQPGTLERALESFDILNDKDFEIVTLGAASHPGLAEQAEKHVARTVAGFKDRWRIGYLSFSDLDRIRSYLDRHGHSKLAYLVSLLGYANVRNMCLVAAQLRGADAVILFDDDEIIEDADYIGRATEYIGRTHQGQFVGGVAGYYVRAEGGYLAPPTGDWWWKEWQGAEAMNEAFSLIIPGKPRLKKTPFAFGGNMVIHRDVFSRVPFDPRITRGEDIDYLTNAKMFGFDFVLDNELKIRHLPPEGCVPDWQGFRQNVKRFVYMREKLQAQREVDGARRVTLKELEPYPARFLGPDLDEKIHRTSVLLALKSLLEKDEVGFQEGLENIEIARRGERPDADPFQAFLGLQADWRELMSILGRADELKSYLEAKIAGRIGSNED